MELVTKKRLMLFSGRGTRELSEEIAENLNISVNTVKTHMRAIYHKLGVTGRSEAIRRAEDLGIA